MLTSETNSALPLDLESDEPTQYMLQLMQTSIKRKMASRTKKFTKFLSILASPIGMVIFLLIACPGLATIFTLFSSFTSNSNFLEDFCRLLLIMTGLLLAFFAFRFFTILLIPMPINSGMLDVRRTDRIILSGLIGNDRWSYINRKLEFELPAKLIRVYLTYILYTLVIFALIGLTYTAPTGKSFIESIRVYIFFAVSVGLFISFTISIFRVTTALKLIVYNLNGSSLTQQSVIILWLSFWTVFGYIARMILFQDYEYLDDSVTYSIHSNLHNYIFGAVFLFLLIYSINKIIKGFKKPITIPTIKTLIQFWVSKKFYFIYIFIGLTFILSIIEKFSVTSVKKISYVLLNFLGHVPISLILVLVAAHLLSIWLNSDYGRNQLKIKHIGIYFTSAILLFTLHFLFKKYNIIDFDEGAWGILERFEIIYYSMPSLIIFADNSVIKLLTLVSNNYYNTFFYQIINNYLEIYIVVCIFPALFARFMENIALQKLPTPKI